MPQNIPFAFFLPLLPSSPLAAPPLRPPAPLSSSSSGRAPPRAGGLLRASSSSDRDPPRAGGRAPRAQLLRLTSSAASAPPADLLRGLSSSGRPPPRGQLLRRVSGQILASSTDECSARQCLARFSGHPRFGRENWAFSVSRVKFSGH